VLLNAARLAGISQAVLDIAAKAGGDPSKIPTDEKGQWLLGDTTPPDSDASTGSEKSSEKSADGDHHMADSRDPNTTEFYSQQYSKADEPIRKLKADPNDVNARASIETLNGEISQFNRKQGAQLIRGRIQVATLTGFYTEIHELMAMSQAEPDDSSIKEALNEVNTRLKDFLWSNAYPEDWNLNLDKPTGESSAVPAQASNAATGADGLQEFMVGDVPCVGVTSQPGHTRFEGEEWKVEGWRKAGRGNRIWLKRPNPANKRYSISIFVAASAIGMTTYASTFPELELKAGTKADLQTPMNGIGGFAPVRTIRSKAGDELDCLFYAPAKEEGKFYWVTRSIMTAHLGEQRFRVFVSNYEVVSKIAFPVYPIYHRVRAPRRKEVAAPAGETELRAGDEKPKADSVCTWCKKTGHQKPECPENEDSGRGSSSAEVLKNTPDIKAVLASMSSEELEELLEERRRTSKGKGKAENV